VARCRAAASWLSKNMGKISLLPCIGIIRSTRRGRAQSSYLGAGPSGPLGDLLDRLNLEARRPSRWMSQLDPSHRSNLVAQMPLGGCPNRAPHASQGLKCTLVGCPNSTLRIALWLKESVFPTQLTHPPSGLRSLLLVVWTSDRVRPQFPERITGSLSRG